MGRVVKEHGTGGAAPQPPPLRGAFFAPGESARGARQRGYSPRQRANQRQRGSGPRQRGSGKTLMLVV